jgi:hypothetical protein
MMSAATFDSTKMKEMMERALKFGAHKLGHHDVQRTLSALGHGDCVACEYVRYGLAQEIAEYIGSVDSSVKAVYTFEPEYATGVDGREVGRPGLSPAISMIAWVDHKSAALSSVVDILAEAVAQEMKQLACPKANALCRMLDVKVVEDDEVQGRLGYGALINSLYMPPLEVWHR